MKNVKLVDKILQHSGDAIIVISLDGVILSANPEALDLLEFSEEELVGKSYYWFFFNQTQNQKLGEMINDGFHRSIEHFMADAVYITPAGHEKKLKVSTALLAEKQAMGKLSDRQSLVLFLKLVDTTATHDVAMTDRVESAQVQRMKRELEQIREQNTQLQSLFSRFDILRLAAAGIVFLVLLLVILYSRNNIQIFPTRVAAVPEQSPQERIEPARLDTMVMEINLSGLIEPYSKVPIIAATSGKVVRRTFQEGDYVEEGDILYKMDTEDLAKSVRSARVKYIELLEQYNELANWDSSLAVMQARRKYELSKIALSNERKKLKETKKLFDKGIIPRVEYEKEMTAFKKAEFDFENAKQALDSELDKGNPDKLEVLRLKLSNAKEELDEIEARYEAKLIRAPVSGIIMKPVLKNGRIGEFKNQGDMVSDGDIVATIGATKAYIINSFVGELNVKDVKEGQQVRISGPSFGHVSFVGKVDWVASNAIIDGEYRYYPVRIILTNVPDSLRREIRLGMYAEVSIHVQTLYDVVTVPIQAVVFKDNHEFVRVVSDEGQYELRHVEIGYSDRERVEIKEGLAAGEQVLIGSTASL